MTRFRSHGNRGEESGRILHASLFQRIWRIAKPSRRLMKSIDNMEKEYEIQYGARKKPKYEKPVDDDNEDFLSDEIEAPKQDEEAGPVAFSSDHSNEILLMGKEAMPDDGEEIGKGRMDLRISVYNNSNLKWKVLIMICNMLGLRSNAKKIKISNIMCDRVFNF